MKTHRTDPRHLAADVLEATLFNNALLDEQLERVQTLPKDPRDQALLRELAIGVVRWYPRLNYLARQLLSKPLKDKRLLIPLLLGIYQLVYTRVPPHAAVSTSVSLAATRGFKSARGLVNGVLRRFERERDTLLEQADGHLEARYAHPKWMANAILEAWPGQAEATLDAANDRAPLSIRCHAGRGTRDDYMQRLEAAGIAADASVHSPFGILVTGIGDPRQLPGFSDGDVSVQDDAAQLAQPLLNAPAGARVLDACAAPGGKTAAILEASPGVQVTALDSSATRLERLRTNLARLDLSAEIVVGDARAPDIWWDQKPYTHILVDAPCSATGIIRRHPDIKLHRRASDVVSVVEIQSDILRALWPLLAPGGTLLYATCSILPIENSDAVSRFLTEHPDAQICSIDADWGQPAGPGRQILTGADNMDGFFYARMNKP